MKIKTNIRAGLSNRCTGTIPRPPIGRSGGGSCGIKMVAV
jgi:hypothetical protein